MTLLNPWVSAQTNNLKFLKLNLIPIYESQWGAGLFIKSPAVPYAAYIFQDYPIQLGLNSTFKKTLRTSSDVIKIKTIIYTNTEIKYRIKEKIVRIENKKTMVLIGILSGVGGIILGVVAGIAVSK